MKRKGRIACDAMGCDETYPLDHECVTEPGFRFGKWLGWLYLDINRPDLFTDQLAFCSPGCLTWWVATKMQSRGARNSWICGVTQ